MAIGDKVTFEQSNSTYDSPVESGKILVKTDERTLYIDDDSGKRIKIGADFQDRYENGVDRFSSPIPKKLYFDPTGTGHACFSNSNGKVSRLATTGMVMSMMPAGVILPYIGYEYEIEYGEYGEVKKVLNAPDGWAFCDGTVVYDVMQSDGGTEGHFMRLASVDADKVITSINGDSRIVLSANVSIPSYGEFSSDQEIGNQIYISTTVGEWKSMDFNYDTSEFVPSGLFDFSRVNGVYKWDRESISSDGLTENDESLISRTKEGIRNWTGKEIISVDTSDGKSATYYKYSETSSYVRWYKCFSDSSVYEYSYLYSKTSETGYDDGYGFTVYTSSGMTTSYGTAHVSKVISNLEYFSAIRIFTPDFRMRFPMGASDPSSETGKIFDATLPNITGTMNSPFGGSSSNAVNELLQGTGALYEDTAMGTRYSAGSASTTRRRLKFDASLSNPIYQDGATVRPPSFGVNWIIKIE